MYICGLLFIYGYSNKMKFLIFAVLFVALLVLLFLFLRPKKLSYAPENAEYIKPKVVQNIVSPEEARYILETAGPKFDDSTILSGKDDNIRKSRTAWLGRDDPTVRSIYERLSKQYNFDIANAEDLQVVEYKPGGFYNEHHDSCCDDNDHCRDFMKKSGQRVLTILIYLNDDFEDGETRFPTLDMSLKADKYGGIVFHPLEVGGNRCHPLALHKGTPVTSGVKYICNLWVRERPF